MVSKHYNIQNPKKPSKQQTTQRSPPPSPPTRQQISVISSAPNPQLNAINDEHALLPSKANCKYANQEKHALDVNFVDDTQTCDRLHPNKELTIGDIGRFQYILQMDREMGSHPDTLYRIPSRQPTASSTPSSPTSSHNGSTMTNTNYINFWKSNGQSANSATTHRHAQRARKLARTAWMYGKWPLLLVTACLALGLIVYFLVLATEVTGQIEKANEIEMEEIEFEKQQNLNRTRDLIQLFVEPAVPTVREEEILAVYVKRPALEKEWVKTTEPNPDGADGQIVIGKSTTSSTTVQRGSSAHSRNTQIIEISTQQMKTAKEDAEEIEAYAKPVEPTKDSFNFIGFTSGHQNNFGIPIEEDERILKMLNEELMKRQGNETPEVTSTTDSTTYRTRVSPTLPILSNIEATTEGLKRNASEDGICQSTSLSFCRGIVPYDLTILKNKKDLTTTELGHFEYLIDSKCSQRAAQFICSVLEPECRPTQMGILQPCKRICKSVLEPCAHIVASSEILTTTFDCDAYPDSNDRNVCEDPTRRSKCLSNEFKCFDGTCIPQQWKCDNIKDCALGDDEENCKFCEQDEFKCTASDKCIPEKFRCDQYDDCGDGSDELDCYEDESRTFPPAYGNARTYPFIHEQNPNNPNTRPYLTISGDDRLASAEEKSKTKFTFTEEDRILPTAAENVAAVYANDNHTDDVDDEDDEIQLGSASGITVPLSKSLANFQDSKEIMMTSDSESDYKFSSSNVAPVKTAHNTPSCPEGELRCVSGHCITVNQLCDKVTDCPDGADEAMCVYKN